MKIVLIGPPGSGKGTQAALLTKKYGIPHLSSGDILRGEVAAGTEFGKMIKQYMDRGEIGPTELITDMVLAHIDAHCPGGFILDGFPRTQYQAEKLGDRHAITAAIFIDVPGEEITARITGRRTCRNCNAIFHVKNSPPKTEGVCDRCGGELYQRQDDNETTVANRIRVYTEETMPVLDYYRTAGLLRQVDGARDGETVFRKIISILS
ncbi:MAG TPA: adenylate kinase [Spirochaetota bacterium]|nr:adenylate kinase [Spirochaetota bacterium]HOD13692.1 adenylate kinase [Spirochaetota bacterium]HPG52047.1 adenylate kinase [Spirochaetota bacterium]HPN13963.1 adenylate kinase [Spirochaetota bacterium]